MRNRFAQRIMTRSPVAPLGGPRAVYDRPVRSAIARAALVAIGRFGAGLSARLVRGRCLEVARGLASSLPVPAWTDGGPAPSALLAQDTALGRAFPGAGTFARRARFFLGGGARAAVEAGALAILAPLLLVAADLAGAADAPTGEPGWERHAALLEGSRDQLVRSARVPSDEQPQGEVRLLRRGAAVVMQTVIQSTVLRRVVAEIRRKELATWPEGSAGAADSRRYVEVLFEAARERGEDHPPPGAGEDEGGGRRRGLLIEFILAERAALVALYEPQIAGGEPRFRLTGRRRLALLELSRAYVRGDLLEIAVDALQLSRQEAEGVLGPLLPPEPEGRKP
jgi:hypothetical protein